ncbi:serine hydrolase domain-containing protein [Kitasatospora sp. NPDC101235]|uniref:serine hydrolase domain-containing protein n=1 Tax=Kitasatospora sp. NPDC101235 TaxID=3364101 RepID=UPI0037FE3A5F
MTVDADRAELAELLTAATAELTREPSVPGLVVAAVRGPESAVHCQGVLRHGGAAPVGPDTRFETGSLTKTFTALLLADLAARAEVGYQEQITAYLPAHARPRRSSVTLLDLATHRGGLPRLPPGFLRRAGWRLLTDPYARYILDDLYAATARLRPTYRPAAARYSTFGIALLGQLLANATGQPYDQLLTDRILHPLGLTRTGATTLADDPTAASGHRRAHPVPYWTFQAIAPAGALHSTGTDLLRYLQSQLAPGQGPLGTAIAQTQQPGPTIDTGPEQFSPGWFCRTHNGRTRFWHSGGTGGFTSYLKFCPDTATGIAVLANTTPARRQHAISLGQRLFAQLMTTTT